MDQIENTAIQTFSMVPEVYQQVFIQASADFPDELVAQIKQDPNQAIELLNSDKALKNAVISIFKNNQETIMNAVNKQTGMFKSGGKLSQGLQKFQTGGGFSKAAGYYKRHANEDIIRKIQNFLYARGYYTGELDGKFGNKTYEAVRKYQREKGLVDDGMWGEDTNSVAKLLLYGNSTFSSPNSGAHPGKHTYKDNFVNQTYNSSSNKVSYTDINNTIERAIKDPEWFWGDSEDAKNWRMMFNAKGAEGILETIYSETPEAIRAKIDYKKLPSTIRETNMKQGIQAATTKAAPKIAAIMAAPVLLGKAVTAPAETGLSAVGSYLEGKFRGNYGRLLGESDFKTIQDENGNIYYRNSNKHLTEDPYTGGEIPTVEPNNGAEGEAVESAIGTIVGGLLGNAARGASRKAIPNTFLFQQGGSITINPKSVKKANKNSYKAPNTSNVTRRSIGYYKDPETGYEYITEGGVVNGNSANTTIVASPTDTLVQQRIFRGERGDLNKTYPRGTSEYESVMRRIRPWFNIFGQ